MIGKPHGHKTNNGKTAWNKGLKLLAQQGANHFAWKGKEVSYRNLHRWVERLIGKPSKCVNCSITGYGHKMHWANLSGHYKRELTDWVRLCPKCHKAYDRNELVLV